MMDTMFGWDATAEVMEDWMYEKVAQAYALDPEMKEWMEKVNPYARQNILDKLLEAISRGMWDAGDDMKKMLEDEYLELEGRLEEWSDSDLPERQPQGQQQARMQGQAQSQAQVRMQDKTEDPKEAGSLSEAAGQNA
jgi:cobalamin biosynthesis Mg chelatase CobN